jgi:hypothetical protein
MPKVVILGSCRFSPYTVLSRPKKIYGKWNTEEGYQEAMRKHYPAIQKADEVWVYAPDGIGEHTKRDLEYAKSLGKTVRIIGEAEEKK